MENQIKEMTAFLNKQNIKPPDIGIILGSGLGLYADTFKNAIKISYDTIVGLPQSTVEGHKGQFVFGQIGNHYVMAMQGRFHYYEGYSMAEVTLPVRLMAALGVKTLIITNAAGGVNMNFRPGDLMLINDHIQLSSDNPLIGNNLVGFGPRFPDTSQTYSPKLIQLAHRIGESMNLKLKEGVYCCFTGPNYETPAEIKMVRFLGGDAVGMSTVPEAIVACHSGMAVLGISCITNCAAGLLDQPLNHHEVIETANAIKKTFIELMDAIVRAI